MATIDNLLATLELPIGPDVLCQKLSDFLKKRDPYDFVADQGAKKAREVWIASRFLLAHAKEFRRCYEITKLTTEAPDIEYREKGTPHESLSIEAAELLSPGYKRAEEYRKNKLERELCEKSGRQYNPTANVLPQEFLENEKNQFPSIASEVLKSKLMNDYGPNCTLVLYVNLWLFGDKPIHDFLAVYELPVRVPFREVWFLYKEALIPVKKRSETIISDGA